MDKKEQAAKRLKERQLASKRFKLPEGDTTFRVLPNAKDQSKAPYIEFGMHQNVGARKAYLRCGKKMNGEGDCWICDTLIPKLEKKGKRAHLKKAEELTRKDSFGVQIIYKVGKSWNGPTFWEVSPGVATKLMGIMSRKDVDHPTKGYNLTINRVGSGLSTKYPTLERDDEKSEVDEKYLAKIKPFSALLKAYDEEIQKTEYYGHEQVDEEPEEDEEEEETTKKKGKGKSKDEEDEEEESEDEEEETEESEDEEEEESEDEEEDEKPKKKKGKKSEDEDEEEESEDDDDGDGDSDSEDEEESEDEDEKPRGKKGKKSKDEDEEEEEEEDDADVPELDEEEEEEDEKPKKGKKSKKSKDEDEEEEEESEDEESEDEDEESEDEEEEEPKKKKGKKGKKGKK